MMRTFQTSINAGYRFSRAEKARVIAKLVPLQKSNELEFDLVISSVQRHHLLINNCINRMKGKGSLAVNFYGFNSFSFSSRAKRS
jgi:hypothetical protein